MVKKLRAVFLAVFQMALYLLCIACTSIVYGAVLRNVFGVKDEMDSYDMLLIYSISCLFVTFVFLMVYRASGKSLGSYLPIKPMGTGFLSKCFLVGAGLNFATHIVMELIPIPPAVILEYEEHLKNSVILSDESVLGMVSMLLLAPLVEEIVFRAGILNTLNRGGVPFAISIQAAAFAVIHGNLYQIIYAFMGGVVLGMVYKWTGNFLAPLFVHITFNGVSAVLIQLERGLKTEFATLVYLIIITASVIGMVHSLKAFYRESRERMQERFDKTV